MKWHEESEAEQKRIIAIVEAKYAAEEEAKELAMKKPATPVKLTKREIREMYGR